MDQTNEIRADVIEVAISGGFKPVHVFRAAFGVLGVLKLKGIKSQGVYQGRDGSELEFKKTSMWKSSYVLEEGGEPQITAKPPKAISRAFVMDYSGEALRLAPGRAKFRSWQLQDSRGSVLLELKPRGAFKRGALIQVRAPVELKLLVFAYCLVNKRWQEESSAA